MVVEAWGGKNCGRQVFIVESCGGGLKFGSIILIADFGFGLSFGFVANKRTGYFVFLVHEWYLHYYDECCWHY